MIERNNAKKTPSFSRRRFNNNQFVTISLEDEQLALSRTPPNR